MGQNNLLKQIYALKSLPHSLLLVGSRGSEEYETVEKIAAHFDYMMYDLTELISKDFIDEIMASHVQTVYYVNLNNMSSANQNILLKFFEEPSEYAYVILVSENIESVLQTIITRSYIFHFDKYTRDDLLKKFPTATEEMLTICETPGQLTLAMHSNLQKLIQLCDLLVSKLAEASLRSTLSIADKINYKDDYSKYDLFLFLRCLGLSTLKYHDYESYKIILDTATSIWLMNNKQNRIELLLIKLWKSKH